MKNLELNLKCDRAQKSVIASQYTAYPLRMSPVLRLDNKNRHCAYLYMMNTSPGLLAGDELNIKLTMAENTNLYLTDQAATKVHPMPQLDTIARVNNEIELAANATLEFIPEPLILYQDAALEQTTRIKLHSTARLFFSEIILPGRLARGESYQFRYYFNRLQVSSLSGEVYCQEAVRLEGKLNPFKESKLFASMPVIGSAIVILPQTNLQALRDTLEDLQTAECQNLNVACSILPDNKGLLIRALANTTGSIKKYLQYAANCVRCSCDRSILPYIAK
ncbi:urease accessory protein UreD [Myxosarcina sp. GI1]|uniref:urease accessory protein UreD n=1 Tax=Myxosarcina sp. GI1 TaxID=1541065 RepID=UPI000564D262|nr:urease accessory protein UreD [Myxosarcina sp. GI1]